VSRTRVVPASIPDRPDLLAGEDLPRPPQQERSLARRNRVEDAALALFAEHGYSGTSVEDIARAAGIPTGGVYLHFRTKRQLLLSLMNDLVIALSRIGLEPATSGAEPRTLIRQLLARGFDRELRYVGAYRAWREAVLTDKELAGLQKQIQAWTTARVAAVFARLQTLRPARRGVDIGTLAVLMDSVFWDLLARGSRRDAEIEQALSATTDLVYHALFTDDVPR
jgi:TetR/AcrR family acrAB operon transcriptional repressor